MPMQDAYNYMLQDWRKCNALSLQTMPHKTNTVRTVVLITLITLITARVAVRVAEQSQCSDAVPVALHYLGKVVGRLHGFLRQIWQL